MTISFLSINLWPDEVRYQLVGQIWNELGPFKPTFWNRINHDSLFGLPAEFRTSASTYSFLWCSANAMEKFS
jgi:hypothetical protein